MVPLTCKLGRFKVTKLFMLANASGIVPEKELPPRSSFTKFVHSEISIGIGPVR